MFIPDLKTILLVEMLIDGVAAAVMIQLWWQNRHRFDGLGWWLFFHLLLFVGLGLVSLRGRIPDLVSMAVANTLVVGGGPGPAGRPPAVLRAAGKVVA